MSSSGDAVRFLLDRDSSILEAEDHEGRTALHLASGHRLGSDGTLVALLEAGANIEARTSFGETPLHEACKALRVSAVQRLLRSGADDGAGDGDGRTPAALTSALLRSQCPGMFQDMLKIILQLLAAAPADNVWRRRGWLLMLRSCMHGGVVGSGGGARSSTAAERRWHHEVSTGKGMVAEWSRIAEWHGEDDSQHSGSSELPRKARKVGSTVHTAVMGGTEEAAAAVAHGAVAARERNHNPGHLNKNNESGVYCLGGVGGDEVFRDRGEQGDEQLRSVVERAVGVCEEGVFRSMVAFL